ncbi:MAG: NADH:ubiquinone reductase (Na(+)-transporting) subunit C, partial [Bacteroidota bacterium]|nr:NADH:ubiquinone reductase (Na(+)-transporting) subunit C [Bacteroidota bacterium]
FTFGFAIIMVIIVAALLSVAYIQLKPLQDINTELEKKQNILSSVGIIVDRDNADAKYLTYIKNEIVLNNKGEQVDGSAFDIDLGKEIKKDADAQLLPLFISEVEGAIRYIIPLRGKGLWGPIWGFIALEDDLNKVYGAVFDHEKETPGLGAEINTPMFQKPFTGKTIFEGEEFIPIQVIKGGAKEGDMHAVDGISGGTITSNGVSDMLYERLNMYLPYLNKIKEAIEVERAITQIDSLAIINDSIIE